MRNVRADIRTRAASYYYRLPRVRAHAAWAIATDLSKYNLGKIDNFAHKIAAMSQWDWQCAYSTRRPLRPARDSDRKDIYFIRCYRKALVRLAFFDLRTSDFAYRP